MNSFSNIPEKGKRYKLRSRPWTSSYIEITESDEGDWVYMPMSQTTKEPTNQEQTCPECGRLKASNIKDVSGGFCPKWWAFRDPDAEADCIRQAKQDQSTCSSCQSLIENDWCPKCGFL